MKKTSFIPVNSACKCILLLMLIHLTVRYVYANTTTNIIGISSKHIEVVEVYGVKDGLQESLAIKRDANGIVDAISAIDIGKFPDTNLAESLQRITGLSISRFNGEGNFVTARGFGADLNMVTLNGRVMPASFR